MMHSGDYSPLVFPGLKTAVGHSLRARIAQVEQSICPIYCLSFEQAVIDVQAAKAKTAVEETGVSDFSRGRRCCCQPRARAFNRGETLVVMGVLSNKSSMALACGDNAAMIAVGAL